MQDSDKTLALALDDIVNAFCWMVFMGFNESLDVLAGFWIRQKLHYLDDCLGVVFKNQ